MDRQLLTKAAKLGRLARRRPFMRVLLRHRVAAAVEHLEPIALTGARTLVDIGANSGQFSLATRALLPQARIEAFEPLDECADRYKAVFRGDPLVRLHRVALSNEETQATFHVTGRRDSSSLLAPGSGQAQAFGVTEESTTTVPVRRLDQCLDLAGLPAPILIKIDVQGAELKVLEGCSTLEHASFIYVELSFVELYEGQALFEEVAAYLFGRGFTVVGVFNQVSTARFGPTQADFLFKRRA